MEFKTQALEVKKKRKILGRGTGTGRGKTSTRGSKGQRSRSGGKGSPYVGFEGGQMPIYRRVKKRGFTNIFKKKVDIINIKTLDEHFDNNSYITIKELKEKKLVKNSSKLVKLLGIGETSKQLNIKLSAISINAKEKIEKAGGSFEVS